MNRIIEWFAKNSVAANLQTIIAMASAGLRKAARHSMGETAPFKTPLPPLAALMAQIASPGQQFGQSVESVNVRDQCGAALVVESRFRIRIFRRGVVAGDAMPVCVMPSDQRHQGLPTKRCGNIAPLHYDALAC